MSDTKESRFPRLMFAIALAFALAATFCVSGAWADTLPELSGDAEKSPRSGVPVPFRAWLHQSEVRDEAMQTLREYRQEAFDEGLVELPEDMTPDEYINGAEWNIDLERIAVQRAIEYASKGFSGTSPHTRPDGTSWQHAESNGVTPSTEGLAGNSLDPLAHDPAYFEWLYSNLRMKRGMEMWHGEKPYYIRYHDNAGLRGWYGHYANLIDPKYKSYGFSFAIVEGSDMITWSVAASTKRFESDGESLGFTGAYDATVYANDNESYSTYLYAFCADGGLKVGDASEMRAVAGASLLSPSCWPVDSSMLGFESLTPDILSVDANGVVSGLAEGMGLVSVTIGDESAVVKVPITDQQAVFRLYNPNSGEHFYTLSPDENANLVAAGWYPEGLGWIAPSSGGSPVYRLYNPYAGEHHYTTDAAERDALVAIGWSDEGVGWNSASSGGEALYREYNPNEFSCNHNYTTDKDEHDYLVSIGWEDEGMAWQGVLI